MIKLEIKLMIKRVSKNSPKNNSETTEEEILRQRYVPEEQRQKVIDDRRLT